LSSVAAVLEAPQKQGFTRKGGNQPIVAKRKRVLASSADRNYETWKDMNIEARDTLRSLLKDPAPQIRLGAAKEILDRTDGRPRQQAQIEIKGDLASQHLDALRAWAVTAQAIDMIDVSPVDNGEA